MKCFICLLKIINVIKRKKNLKPKRLSDSKKYKIQ